jgi:hypothetical protein
MNDMDTEITITLEPTLDLDTVADRLETIAEGYQMAADELREEA